MKISKEQLKKVIKEELEQVMEQELSPEANELLLYIENDGDLYRQQYQPILKNLITKKARGDYNPELAIKLFMYLVNNGAKKYNQENGMSPFQGTDVPFSKQERLEVAKELRDKFENEAELGNYDNYLPKKYANQNKFQEPDPNALKESKAPSLEKWKKDVEPKLGKPIPLRYRKKDGSFDFEKQRKEKEKKPLQETSPEEVNKEMDSYQSLADPKNAKEIDDANKDLQSFKSLKEEDNMEEKKDPFAKMVAREKESNETMKPHKPLNKDEEKVYKKFNKDKIKEAITKVLQEKADLLEKIKEGCGGIKKKFDLEEEKLEEEKIEHLNNAEEDFSEDPHNTEMQPLSEAPQEDKGEQDEDASEDNHLKEGKSNPYQIAWNQFKKDNK